MRLFESCCRLGSKLPGKTVRMYSKSLTLDSMNPSLMKLQYAIRGPLTVRSLEIGADLKRGVSKSFKSITTANIGDPQCLGQRPLTFFRQVFAAVLEPPLMSTSELPKDVKERAEEILAHCNGGSISAYSAPLGLELVRHRIAEALHRRDGVPADWQHVWLTTGASTGLKNLLKLFASTVDGKPSSIMIPTPQYPLYSATTTEYGIEQAYYYLDEDDNWSLSMEELERCIQEAKKTTAVRAIVVINPGNPTGQVLTRKNIEEVVKFAHKHRLFIIADEVYQENVYAEGSKFYSFKKVLTELGPPYSSVELASAMSASKGYVGECGTRGGYMEFVNMDPEVMQKLYVVCSCGCPPLLGQVCMDLIARPPQEGEESYDQFVQERDSILESLRQRAALVTETFNQMDGFSCNVVQGAMYAFPKISLPPKAIEKATAEGMPPDVYYCFRLLEETGICVVPGSGFGQKAGTHHFRTTILPQPEQLKQMMDTFKDFHKRFTIQHS